MTRVDVPYLRLLNKGDSRKSTKPSLQRRKSKNVRMLLTQVKPVKKEGIGDNFRMNTGYGRYGATYIMVGFSCFNEELLCV
jgi:hypothetical protein